MRVHVVIRSWKADRIVPRLARLLVAHNKWTISSQPRKDVDLNYFLAYFEWLYQKSFKATPFAVLLTHLEEDDPGKNAKAKAFMDAAKAADIRVSLCKKYARIVDHLGPTFCVRMPLDRNHFRIKSHKRGSVPVVGISGFTYKSSRKGQDLVQRLVGSPLGQSLDLRASGRGWPLKVVKYPWRSLPTFFQSLDFLLCPSRVESGPMPVLEAMSCGVPCIIPRDVGLLDELPDLPDLYRYQKGNFKSMCQAIRRAVGDKRSPDHATLRAAVGCYSDEAWAKDHRAGFQKALSQLNVLQPTKAIQVPKLLALTEPDPLPPKLPPLAEGNFGIYIVAMGDPARAAAKICMTGIRKHLKGVPIALCSDRKLGLEHVLVKQPDKDIGGRSPKVRAYNLAPKKWQYVLYLDADTEVVSKDVMFYFKLVQAGWEFVIATDPHLKDLLVSYKRRQGQDDYFATLSITATDQALIYNGGVWAFRRCPRVAQFFGRWFQEWNRFGAKDQGALIRAMYADPLRVYVLGNEWNYFPKHARKGQKTAGIVHYPGRARRWKGQVPGRLDTPTAWAMVEKEARKRKRR